MPIFASKAALMALGLAAVVPSNAHMHQDCYICKEPLHVIIRTTVQSSDTHHLAVRIAACGHVHGQECLEAWLDTGNSCPTCKHMLFDTSGRSVTQADINSVVRTLGRLVGEARIMSSIARLMDKHGLKRAQLRRAHEELQRVKATEALSPPDDLMDDDDWLESGEEDLDMHGDYNESESELDEEDEELQSATV